MTGYDIEVEEYAEDGETPELFCVLLNGHQVGPAHGTRQEAQVWIDAEIAAGR